jgi:hydrogenase maturation protein HypF
VDDRLLAADTETMTNPVRAEIRVTGIVQGVGFRPFVQGLAVGLGVAGHVGNDAAGVFIDVEGSDTSVESFLHRLRTDAPPLASIEEVTVRQAAPTGATSFRIVHSADSGGVRALVSSDSATCIDCLRELADPTDRRFRYPFINCTNCGPRFTIVRGVPYDRVNTTMAGFPMCTACNAEYSDPTDRRFHAQPVCCPECGPSLRLVDATGHPLSDNPIADAGTLLRRGEILAVKGLGGYHLAVDARDEPAAARLRARKHREDKPFAVMAASIADARALVEVDEAAAALLSDRRRPIVLLDRRPDTALAASVAPSNRQLGVMLPYTPLHHLLLREFAGPLVLTSGNVSDEPIAYADQDALDRLSTIADGFLTHNREIYVRTDDSVARPLSGKQTLVRRSRGYAPEPITVEQPFRRHILACGAELKNTFCLAKDRHAFVSHHIGDLENYETLRSFTEGIEHFRRLFDIHPAVAAYDLHPEYLSTKYALDLTNVELVGVQHHHAHIASCLTDNAESGPVLGVAFDGTGYGTDGTLWGGEFLLADLAGFRRLAHLTPIAMPGGATAIRQPWRMAAAYLDVAYDGHCPENLDVVRRNEQQWPSVLAVAHGDIHALRTSSAGRLFDAAAAVLGIRDSVNYEGQAAIELEQHADIHHRDSYPAPVLDGAVPQLSGADLLREVTEDLRAGTAVSIIAARFHNSVAEAVVRMCEVLADRVDVRTVALSGGVFQNLLLLHRLTDLLGRNGFRVLTHARVPTNDGGISLGQAAVAGALDRQAST